MAHFAEIDANNIVLRVLVVGDDNEHRGQEFLADDLGLGGTWIQTSYNTINGVHRLGGTPFRLNYAAIGMTYDAGRDAFRLPDDKGPKGWTVDDDGRFVPPTPEPDGDYYWEEATETWEPIVHPEGYDG